MSGSADDYSLWVRELLQALGVPISAIAARDLPLWVDAEELVVAEVGKDGRVHQLTRPPQASGLA